MTTMDRLNAALVKPMTHAVVTKYDDGVEKRHETRNFHAAQNYVVGESRKIGLVVVRRDPVTLEAAGSATVVSVEVVAL